MCSECWASHALGFYSILCIQLQLTCDCQLCTLSFHLSGFLKRELLFLNVAAYLPSKTLVSDHVMDLCRDIFERGMKIKPELRKGVWPHLVGVFHPDMKSREERELYFNRLRRVYDSLRGK